MTDYDDETQERIDYKDAEELRRSIGMKNSRFQK